MTADESLKALGEYLESQDFYELCQTYRTASLSNQEAVIRTFENLKHGIRTAVLVEKFGGKPAYKPRTDEIV